MLISLRESRHAWRARHAQQHGLIRCLGTFVTADADRLIQADASVIHPRSGNALNSQGVKCLPVLDGDYAIYQGNLRPIPDGLLLCVRLFSTMVWYHFYAVSQHSV